MVIIVKNMIPKTLASKGQCNAKVLVKNGTHLRLHVCARVGYVAAVLVPVSVHESHIATSSGSAQQAPRHDPEQHHYQKIS
jgi:hypothetical protein